MTEAQDPAAFLWHYTDAAGLLGIVKANRLRATDIQFLNDGEEMIYAAREISMRLRAAGLERLDGIADGVDGHADGRYAQVFVTCFCNRADLLSQWRGYGRRAGFALGFDRGALNAAAKHTSGHLERVRYGAGATDPLIEQMLGLPATGFPGAHGWAYAREYVLPWLARVKSPAFEEEAEWRVIVNAEAASTLGGEDEPTRLAVEFRSAALGIVPYIDIDLLNRQALRHVLVGPGPHPQVRKIGAQKLLAANDYDGVPVTLSAVADSYRF